MGLLAIAMFMAIFSLVAKRLSTTIFTAPIIFISMGLLLSYLELIPVDEMESTLHLVAEVALILLLFLDAAKIDLPSLRKQFIWPARMLFIGLPLSILVGTLVTWLIIPEWPIAAIALVAAILAPTDAALGQPIIDNEKVPVRVRRTLITESGLNDGLALPAILLFAAMTATMSQGDETNWLLFGFKQLAFGPIAGVIVGLAGGTMLLWAKRHAYTTEVYEGVGAVSIAASSYLLADLIGGNGFIAAFVAGLSFGSIVKDKCKFVFEFTESEGQGLVWIAFLLIGLLLVPAALEHLTLQSISIILISLFFVRPLAVWISLIGTDADFKTRLFFGWFGPRGLATALFALTIVHEISAEYGTPILHLAVNSVWISALLHGITAIPGANWYASVSRQTNTQSTKELDQ